MNLSFTVDGPGGFSEAMDSKVSSLNKQHKAPPSCPGLVSIETGRGDSGRTLPRKDGRPTLSPLPSHTKYPVL